MIWGLGIAGINRPVFWGVYLVNFVYFVGIGHAGTFISAAFRALRIPWRAPISRAAETLTVFALMTAALFPLLHLGRPWKVYWLIPFPNQRQMWPSMHSPLMWDFFAIFTYLTCSLLFAYLSLIPDLAKARDRKPGGWRQGIYHALALGWRGTQRQWSLHTSALDVFTYAIIPVMFSVHTVVAWDFATALQPGWHSTVFGPYFVIGALFSGTAAVIIVMSIVRKALRLEYFIRPEHFDGMGKFLLILSITWAYFYFNDYIIPWYGQEPAEKALHALWQHGSASLMWFLMLFANIAVPWLALWSRRVRRSVPAMLGIGLLVQVGMYLERYLIIPVALTRNYLPFDWGSYAPRVEVVITAGAFSAIGLGFLLYSKMFPIIPATDVIEGQHQSFLHRVGRALFSARTEPD
jgi:Ni/Fe-hydrogenase subunit HybB-like protein